MTLGGKIVVERSDVGLVVVGDDVQWQEGRQRGREAQETVVTLPRAGRGEETLSEAERIRRESP